MGKVIVARGKRSIGLDGSTIEYYDSYNVMTSNRKNSKKNI